MDPLQAYYSGAVVCCKIQILTLWVGESTGQLIVLNNKIFSDRMDEAQQHPYNFPTITGRGRSLCRYRHCQTLLVGHKWRWFWFSRHVTNKTSIIYMCYQHKHYQYSALDFLGGNKCSVPKIQCHTTAGVKNLGQWKYPRCTRESKGSFFKRLTGQWSK